MARVRLDETLTRDSIVVQTAQTIQERLETAAEEARAVEVVRSLRAGDVSSSEQDTHQDREGRSESTVDGQTDSESYSAGNLESVPDSDLDSGLSSGSETGTIENVDTATVEDTQVVTAPVTKTSSGPRGQQAEATTGEQPTGTLPEQEQTQHELADGIASRTIQQATVYRLYDRGREIGTSSWLYQWLTKEPEPEVIVIDLRETRTAGPILVRLEELIQELLPATVSSAIVRGGYRLRNRAIERPVRVVSFVTISLVVAILGVLAVSDDPIGGWLFILFGMLMLAVRGTQSTRSWAEIAETRWYQWLEEAFEPPEPPESADPVTDDHGDKS